MNNGGIATYNPDITGNNNEYGTKTAIHVYEYTVGSAQSENIAKLSVSAINANGAVWKDSAILASGDQVGSIVTDKIKIANLPAQSNLADSRTIKIDNVKPTITKIEPVSATGYFAEDASILLKMEFSEDVTITNPGSLAVQFTHTKNGNNVTTTSSTVSGSKYVLFEYKVSAGENANPLTFNSLLHTNVTVKDLAGNTLSNWTPSSRNFAGFVVDTTAPAAPGFGTWAPQSVIFSEAGTSFTITGETGAEIEYTTDGGTNWIPYTTGSTITITNNGTYHVKARQTDKAGNMSPASAQKDFTIDKGELLTKITASTSSGTYSTNTATNKIEGRIEFRKPVTIASGAKVTLNVNNSTKQVAIKECASGAHESNVFTFDYTITEGDSITSNAKLDVVGWTFSNVTFKDANDADITVAMAVPAAGNNKRLNENRDIYILTGKPTIADGKITLVEENGKPVLKVEFDRAITKMSGTITITQDTSEGNYHVPAVLSVDEYNELTANSTPVGNTTVQAIIAGAYKKGVNGASYSVSDGKTIWTNDVTAKYVLDFDIDDTENTSIKLVSAFIAANKHKVSIPVVADEVTITNSVLKIDLSDVYKLPVKGASYTVSIPAGLVTDAVQNTNALKTGDIVVSGVEKPVIRLDKKQAKYTITNAGNTANANANMETAQSINMRANCQTPVAEMELQVTIKTSTEVRVFEKEHLYETKTPDPSVPILSGSVGPDEERLILGNYIPNDTEIILADGNDYLVDTYDNAKGLKIAIRVTAKNPDTNETATSYEYATRTVLKFNLASHWENSKDNFNELDPSDNLRTRDLKVWLMGGDSPYGGNSKDPFPLSWSDPGSWYLMRGSFTSDNMVSQWYVVSWDISSATYHGFAIGTVPGDAETNGPDIWYPAENSWTSQKSNYVLYPGETLIMDTANTAPTFWFRQSNRTRR